MASVAEQFDDVDLDLDAREGQKKEGTSDYTAVKLRGQRIEFPPPRDWTTDAVDALEDGDTQGWMEEVLGAEKVAELTDEGRKPFRMGQLEDIFEAINKKNGIDPKSQERSSRRSGNPSKRKR